MIFNPWEPEWKKWFAWHPVKIEERWVWLKTIFKRTYLGYPMSWDPDWHEYKLIKENLK